MANDSKCICGKLSLWKFVWQIIGAVCKDGNLEPDPEVVDEVGRPGN